MRICLRGEGSLRVTKLDGRARAYSVHANHKCNQVIGSISGGIGHMSRPRLSLGDRGRRRRLEREGRGERKHLRISDYSLEIAAAAAAGDPIAITARIGQMDAGQMDNRRMAGKSSVQKLGWFSF